MKKIVFLEQRCASVIENPPFGTILGGKDAAEGVESS